MEPITILASSALYLGAQIVRKPADEFASVIWKSVKQAFVRVFGKEPDPESLTESNLATVIAEEPSVGDQLESVFTHFTALRRARLIRQVVQGAKILWIDDHPENNTWERGLLSALGAHFVTVESTRSALACLRAETFDVLLSDIAREGNGREGVDAIPQIRSTAGEIPIIFYTGHLLERSPPRGAQGITTEPNELLHLVFDQLERSKV